MPPSRPIVLVGMMGAGKSTVARALGAQLGWPVVDLDEMIGKREGRSPAEIIRRDGEERFRTMERVAVRRLTAEDPITSRRVVAAGGWTIGDADNLNRLAEWGTVVCLDARASTLQERTEESGDRPLAPGATRADWTAMLDARWPGYGSVPRAVATDDRSTADVAREVRALALATERVSMQSVPVARGRDRHRVVMGVELRHRVGTILRAGRPVSRVALITDANVAPLYSDLVIASLRDAGFDAEPPLVLPAGERAKRPEVYIDVAERLAARGLDRSSALIGLGGGVVTDVTGFLAATLLRGLRWIAVPTTLLGMVDAAIGGKTGVNLASGKNLLGAFWQPGIVVTDPQVLATLAPRVLREGLAEVVKAALIGDPELLANLEGDPWSSGRDPDYTEPRWSDLIARSAAVKARIVSRDPREQEGGPRVLLNLGHTFAHALELVTGHTIPHGEAVSVGLVMAARLAVRRGIADQEFADRIVELLAHLGLPIDWTGASPEDVLTAMATDKKRRGGLRFVLPAAPGDCRLFDDVPTKEVHDVIRQTRRPEPPTSMAATGPTNQPRNAT